MVRNRKVGEGVWLLRFTAERVENTGAQPGFMQHAGMPLWPGRSYISLQDAGERSG
jgi:hypothetical protein